MIRNLGQVAAIYIGSSQPTNTNLIWLDNTVVPYAFRAYDGSTWSELATRDWVKMFVDGWLVSLPPSTQAGDTDYLLINSNNVNYKITVKEFVKSAVGNPLDFKGVIRTDADFPNPANCEAGDMYVIITSPVGGTVTDPYSGQVFEDTEKIVWDEVTKSWASLGKIEINVDLSTDYSATNVTINSSAGKSTTIEAASTSLAGVMLPQQVKRLTYLSNGSTVPGDPSELDPDTPAHKHNYGDILDRLISQQETGDSTFHPMSQKATTDNLDLKFDKANVVQVQGASTVMVMSQKAVTDAITTLDEWIKNELTKYLPLAGGNMYGALVMNNNVGVNAKNTLGKTYNLAVLDSNNQVQLGTTSYSTRINSSASDLIHQRSSTQYKIWDSYNLSKPTVYNGGAIGTPTTIYDRNLSVNGTGWTFLSATNAPTTSIFAPTTVGTKGYYLVSSGTGAPVWQQLEDLGDGKYLPLIGGTLTGQLTIKQSVDIKLRLQSTDADNYCIIQAINAQASQLGVFGYAGDKWAIGHNGIYYEIWDKYNLTNPVTYTTDTYNYATLTNKDGQYFTYIKAGTNGLLPHSKATLVSGGSGFLGTSDQSFNAAYINNLHTNKVTFGVNGSYIIGGTSATQFLDANGGVQKVATGGLYVGVSYASDALNLVPTNGIYSHGIIYIENGIGFRNSIWTNDLTPNRNYSGYLQVLDAANAGGPTNYGTVLQVNSKKDHWANQLWFSGGAEAGKKGLYYRHMAYNQTEYGEWNRLLTNKDVNIIQRQSSSNPSTLPANQIFYSEMQRVDGTPTDQGALFSVQGDDEGIQLWASSSRNKLYYRTKWTSYGDWIKLVTEFDLNSYLTKTEASTLYYPYNGRGYLSITSTGKPVMSNEQGYAVKDKDGNEREVLWMGANNALYLGNTSQYTLGQLDLRCTTLTHNGSSIATQNYVTNQLSNYLPLTGGTLTGQTTISTSNTSVPLIINYAASGATDCFIRFNLNGTASGAVGFLSSKGTYLYNYSGGKYLFLKSDGVYFGTDSSDVRLATLTDLSGYLPLSGGTMSGNIALPDADTTLSKGRIGTTKGESLLSWHGSNVWVSSINYTTYIRSSTTDLIHKRGDTNSNYKIWDAYNLDKPLKYNSGTAGSVTTAYLRSLGVNGTSWDFLSDKSTATTSIYAPTTVGTSGQILQSSGTGAPVWANVSTVMDGYLPLSGGIMTGAIQLRTQKIMAWAQGQVNQTILESDGNNSYLGMGDGITYIKSGSYDLYHDTGMASYKIWDENNLQFPVISTSTRRVSDIQVVDTLPTTQVNGVLYLVVG